MKETCENCNDFADCLGICEKIKQQLEELPKWPPESPKSQEIDSFRNINPGSLYEDALDTEIDWEKTSPQPVAAEIEESEQRLFDEALRMATRDYDLKFKCRIRAFLRCENITKITARSGTSKQNIQQQFQRAIGRMHRLLLKGKPSDKKVITPLRFKKKVNYSDI